MTDTHVQDHVSIVEVGPRDGLQNESTPIPVQAKISLIERLASSGLKHIECGSFVSPKWVPQMDASAEVLKSLQRQPGVIYSALTPNLKGLEGAINAGADQVAIFTAASETFCQKNINCSIAESIERFLPVIEKARDHNLPVRAYVSCIHSCPYEGRIAAEDVADLAHQLLELGCYEISLGDTIGVATPTETRCLLDVVGQTVPKNQTALHFHDTYGQAIANIYAALEQGYRIFDSSVAGLGGCPYAEGASGNVATEDVVYMLNGAGMHTGIDLDLLIESGHYICQVLDRDSQSKVARARTVKAKPKA